MTLRHLTIFVTVAENLNMHAAAEKLFISQPAVSQAVRELEEHYGVKLFERLNRRIYLTEAGSRLLSYARHILHSCRDMEEAMKSEREHPQLRIGASVSVGTVLLGGYIKRFEQQMPNAETFVTVDNTSEIEKKLCLGELDLAIVEGEVQNREFLSHAVTEDELVLVVGRAHRFYEHPDITMEDLNGESLISREQGSMDRNQLERFLSEHKIYMRKKWSCTNTEAIKNAVTNGNGIAILSRLLLTKELASGELRVLNVQNISVTRTIRLFYHKNKYLSEAMKVFLSVCLPT